MNERGSSLLEVIIAASLLTLAITMSATLGSQLFSEQRAAYAAYRDLQSCYFELQRCKDLAWDALVSDGSVGRTVTTLSPRLKQVTVSVNARSLDVLLYEGS